MMAFDHIYYEVAKQQALALVGPSKSGEPGTFLFREFYCNEPKCDCRRVILHVHWVEARQIVASINYAFEVPDPMDGPQFSLDPLNPQSAMAETMLNAFQHALVEEPENRRRLQKHYEMFKEVVDNPRHPLHAKVRSAAHDEPSFRPAFPAREKKRPRQASAALQRRARPNVPTTAASPSSGQSIVQVAAKAAGADDKIQRRFKQVLTKVERLRTLVRSWREQEPNIRREIASYGAMFERQAQLANQMVVVLDRGHETAALSKADRRKLSAIIVGLAAPLLTDECAEERTKAIYNRHTGNDFDAEVAADDEASAMVFRELLESFGVDFGDADVSSMDKLSEFGSDWLRQNPRVGSTDTPQRTRKLSRAQAAREAKKADEERNAHKAVQEVYRTLAMEWHPDREQDPTERERKAGLMREVNIAYEGGDLLRLLELQLQLEQVDATSVEAIAEERARRYIHVLQQQAKQLASELHELSLPFRLQVRQAAASLTPKAVLAQIATDTESVRLSVNMLEEDLAFLAEPTRLKAWIRMRSR